MLWHDGEVSFDYFSERVSEYNAHLFDSPLEHFSNYNDVVFCLAGTSDFQGRNLGFSVPATGG